MKKPQEIPCEQLSPEWIAARLGRPTASQFAKLITPVNGDLTKDTVWLGYLYDLVCEDLTGVPVERRHQQYEWIEYGRRHENDAAEHLQFVTGLKLRRSGFWVSPCGRYGASPDRVVEGKRELVEIKAPQPWTHIGYWLSGTKHDHRPQIQGQLLVTGYERVHFVSYRHDMPAFYEVHERDEVYIRKLHNYLDNFCNLLAAKKAEARRLGLRPGTDTPAPSEAPALMPPV